MRLAARAARALQHLPERRLKDKKGGAVRAGELRPQLRRGREHVATFQQGLAQAGFRHDACPFGQEVIREMNRLGIVIDLSHAADSTVDDVLKASAAPVIASQETPPARIKRFK